MSGSRNSIVEVLPNPGILVSIPGGSLYFPVAGSYTSLVRQKKGKVYKLSFCREAQKH